MSWEDQGRQHHMWFGHGTAGSKDKLPKAGVDPLFAAGNVELRIDAVALGALMHMPRKDWHRSVLSFNRQRLERLRTAMTAWIGVRSLSHAAFEAKLVDPLTSNNAIKEFRAAAKGAQTAQTHQDLQEASGHLAAGMQGVGLGKWPGFLRDAADRAETYQPSDGSVTKTPTVANAGAASQQAPRPTSATNAAVQVAPVPVKEPPLVTADHLRAIMPNAGDTADRYVEPLNQAMAAHGINTSKQRAAFLAQISVESRQLQDTVENLNYSARRITKVWPQRFPTEAAAAPYAHNPVALGNRPYAVRNGNGDEASGDGFRFRGRGLIQVTGRGNYRDVGFENNPEALEDPQTAANTAAAYWVNQGLNGLTTGVLNRAQFDAVSRTLNGGNTGLQERWDAYQRTLHALNVVR